MKFAPPQLKHRDRKDQGKPEPESPRFDFSYSGIKTAVLRYVETNCMQAEVEERRKALTGTGARCERSAKRKHNF